MSYDLFYVYFVCTTIFTIITIVGLILTCYSFKHEKNRNSYKSIVNFFILVIFFVAIFFWGLIPSVKDYFGIKHNKYAMIQGSIVLKKNLWKFGKFYVRINNIDIKLAQENYENMTSNTNYKITYLTNTKIAIKIEKR